MNNSKNQTAISEVTLAEAQHIGYGQMRQTLEDRCAARSIRTAGGLDLNVGIVADGIGGASAGEAAGQLLLDTVTNFIQNSNEKDVSHLLNHAIQAAHNAIRQAATTNIRLRSMGTTATVAAINDGKLYLAHIGDSRAYLVREGKLTQLTVDHTWGNEKIREGLLTTDQVARHPRKDELARYVGQPGVRELDIDLGLRLDGGSDPANSTLTQGGLSLLSGDVIVLCTDGLIKERQGVQGHFVEPEEIVKVVQRNDPQDAANTLVSLALGRQVDDNISVVILEPPGKKKKIFMMPTVGKPTLLTTAIVAVLVGLIMLVVALAVTSKPSTQTSSSPSPVSSTVIALATNPIPGCTADCAEVLDAVGFKYKIGDKIPAGEDVKLWTTSTGMAKLRLSDGSMMYLGEATTVYLTASSSSGENGNLLTLERGKILVVSNGLTVKTSGANFLALVKEGVMGVNYEDIQGSFQVDCLKGLCQVGALTLQGGQRSWHERGAEAQVGEAIYEGWLKVGGADVPTPTAIPTATPTETPTSTLTSTPTHTLAPQLPTPELKETEAKRTKPPDTLAPPTKTPVPLDTPASPTPAPP